MALDAVRGAVRVAPARAVDRRRGRGRHGDGGADDDGLLLLRDRRLGLRDGGLRLLLLPRLDDDGRAHRRLRRRRDAGREERRRGRRGRRVARVLLVGRRPADDLEHRAVRLLQVRGHAAELRMEVRVRVHAERHLRRGRDLARGASFAARSRRGRISGARRARFGGAPSPQRRSSLMGSRTRARVASTPPIARMPRSTSRRRRRGDGRSQMPSPNELRRTPSARYAHRYATPSRSPPHEWPRAADLVPMPAGRGRPGVRDELHRGRAPIA